jgi:hypothetical protein
VFELIALFTLLAGAATVLVAMAVVVGLVKLMWKIVLFPFKLAGGLLLGVLGVVGALVLGVLGVALFAALVPVAAVVGVLGFVVALIAAIGWLGFHTLAWIF